MTETKTYTNTAEHIAALQERLDKLEIRARTSFFKSVRQKARTEAEQTKRLIRRLRKLESGKIEHAIFYDEETTDYDD